MIFSSCEWFYISFDGSACFFVVPALSDPFAPLLDNKKCAHEGRIKNAVHLVAKQKQSYSISKKRKDVQDALFNKVSLFFEI